MSWLCSWSEKCGEPGLDFGLGLCVGFSLFYVIDPTGPQLVGVGKKSMV